MQDMVNFQHGKDAYFFHAGYGKFSARKGCIFFLCKI